MRPDKAYLDVDDHLNGVVMLQYDDDTYHIKYSAYFDVSKKTEIPMLEDGLILDVNGTEVHEYPTQIKDHGQETFDKYIFDATRKAEGFSGTVGQDDGWTP